MFGFDINKLSTCLSESLKKRAIRYLLQRYVGQFLEESLSLEQLSLDISKGTGTVTNLKLDPVLLNDVVDQLNLPFKINNCSIAEISVSIPWGTLLSQSCFVEVDGLFMSVEPEQMSTEISMVDSLFESMTSSIQLAQECLNQLNIDEDDDQFDSPDRAKTFDGIEQCAQTIDTVLNRVKVRFTNSIFRVEYAPPSNRMGIAVECHFKTLDYFDEAGFEKEQFNPTEEGRTQFEFASFTSKKFHIEGISLYNEVFLKPTHESENLANFENDVLTKMEPVLFAKVNGRQEVRIKLKQNDEVGGPKVNIEANFGSLVCFITPHQVHQLIELVEGIISPEKVEKSQGACKPKLMNQGDFRRVESEVLNMARCPDKVSSLTNNGWSRPPAEESEDEFYPVNETLPERMTSSQVSDCSELTSSYSSTLTGSTYNGNYNSAKRPHRNKKPKSDFSCDNTNTSFKLKVGGAALLILHDDIFTPVEDEDSFASSNEMSAVASNFFESLGPLSLIGHSMSEFSDAHLKFDTLCKHSHLRIVLSPLVLEGCERTSPSKWQLIYSISINYFNMKECLETPSSQLNHIDVIWFDSIESNGIPITSTKPKINLSIKHLWDISTGPYRQKIPKIHVKAALEPCSLELDVSMIDRISCLLDKRKILVKRKENLFSPEFPPSHLDKQAHFKHLMNDLSNKSEIKIHVALSCPLLETKVRFPIPDLRPVSDMNRVPWWKRNVRNDILTLKCEEFYFETSSDPSSHHSAFEVRSRDILFLFQEKLENKPISILRAMVQEGTPKGFDPIRVMIHCYPPKSWINLEDNPPQTEDLMTKSMMGFLEDLSEEEPSIFSTRQFISKHNASVAKELTAPAEKEKILKFVDDCLGNVKYQVDISIPDLQILLPSKHLCEVIYNRLVSDLLLWEPTAPRIKAQQNPGLNSEDFDAAFTSPTSKLAFPNLYSCNPFTEAYSSFDNDNQNLFEESKFYSIHENKISRHSKPTTTQDGQTFLFLSFNIGKSTAILRTPYRDLNSKILPGRSGEVIILLECPQIYTAVGYKGNIDSTYVATLAKDAYVYHRANTSASFMNLGSTISVKNMSKVLYPTQQIVGLRKGIIQDCSTESKFSFSLKMDFDISKNAKSIVFAGGLRHMTLKHLMTPPSENLFAQLGDMFNVEDYPIAGYELPEVITELNFHVELCQIEYQPLNLPLKALACIDSLSISSNLTVSSDTSILYLMLEDAGLFLSQSVKTKDVNIKDYVCVVDLGIFEFCLKIIEGESKSPIQELTVSNNKAHIRTCADSCKALLELLIYLANDGDLVEDSLEKEEAAHSEPVVIDPIQFPESTSMPAIHVRTYEDEILKNMMLDAMKEASPPKPSNRTSHAKEKGVEMFFFPDENLKKTISENRRLPMRTSFEETTPSFVTQSALEEALEDIAESSIADTSSSTDEEFCILEFSTGSGIKFPASNEPQIRVFDSGPTVIYDDYMENIDLYKKNRKQTPKPVLKYSLKELTIIWHLYGGNDFSTTAPKKVRISDNNSNNKVSLPSESNTNYRVHYSNGNVKLNSKARVLNSNPRSPNMNSYLAWYAAGGTNRSHHTLMEVQLSKVQFLYEAYPEPYEQISKHLLYIHDIEVRDRLVTSKINKFLYQYSSESCPKQTNANMVQIKAQTFRSEPQSSSEEMTLDVSIQPLRLNIDQEALLFLCTFFEQVALSDKSEFAQEELPQAFPVQPAPVMTINLNNLSNLSNEENLVIIDEKLSSFGKDKNSQTANNQPIFIKSFCFSPQVPIKIDYHGNYNINSQYGALAGLLIGIGQLSNSEIILKRIVNKSGLLGFNKLTNFALNEWTTDIRRSQLPSILGGIGPMHSFVRLFSGLRDFFWLPIEQYHKDGRVIRGLQRGTYAFTTSSAFAVLDLSGRFVSCIQSAAETMYDIVSSGPSDRSKLLKKRPNQPQDIREGVTTAYELVRAGLGDTANAIVKAAAEEHTSKGVTGAVGGVLRQIPPTVVQPIILASEATCTVIGGVKNQLVPDARREAVDKWKHQ